MLDKEFVGLLNMMLTREASDLHIVADKPLYFRVNGRLMPLEHTGYSNDDILRFIKSTIEVSLGEEHYEQYLETGDADYAVTQAGKEERFRINAYRERGRNCIAIRHIPRIPKNFAELGLPEDTGDLLKSMKGLIVVTGPAGSGKTTTIAAMINWLNQNKQSRIITIEDPIEYHFESNRCLITQREVGTDTSSFDTALRQALRQDPDVIVVGEIRDFETMRLAASAAETGHLVLATLHSPNTQQAINRMIDLFPSRYHEQIRVQLSTTLKAVYAQRLIQGVDGRLVLLLERVVQSPSVANLIRKQELHQMKNFISSSYGNLSFEESLNTLLRQGRIDRLLWEEYMEQIG